MRKQYFFQPSPKGFYAWDVHRLVKLSKGLPVIQVELNKIKEIDENFWYQENGSKPTCKSIVEHMRLVNDTDLKYPIILSKEGKVMDGMHRVLKALLLNQERIKAVQFKEDIQPDYVDVQENELPYD